MPDKLQFQFIDYLLYLKLGNGANQLLHFSTGTQAKKSVHSILNNSPYICKMSASGLTVISERNKKYNTKYNM